MGTPNDFSLLMPSVFQGLNIVSKEPADLLNAITISSKMDMVAKNQPVTYPISTPKTAFATAASANGAGPDINGSDQAVGTVVMDTALSAGFPLTAEESRQLESGNILGEKTALDLAECFRTLRNGAIKKVVDVAILKASSAVSTAGTTPFASSDDLSDFARLKKRFTKYGSPMQGRSLIIDSNASYNATVNLKTLFKASERGQAMQDSGAFGMIQSFNVGECNEIGARTTALGTAVVIGISGDHAVGAKKIYSTADGTIIPGDVVAKGLTAGASAASVLAADKYVVTAALAGGYFTIAEPGLKTAVAGGQPIYKVSTLYTPNMAFTKDAIHLVTRKPLWTANSNGIVTYVEDELVKGLIYQIAYWSQTRQQAIEVAAIYGVGVPNPQNLCLLLG
jgi:hypothetical protein